MAPQKSERKKETEEATKKHPQTKTIQTKQTQTDQTRTFYPTIFCQRGSSPTADAMTKRLSAGRLKTVTDELLKNRKAPKRGGGAGRRFFFPNTFCAYRVLRYLVLSNKHYVFLGSFLSTNRFNEDSIWFLLEFCSTMFYFLFSLAFWFSEK